MLKEVKLSPKRKKIFIFVGVTLALVTAYVRYYVFPVGTGGRTWITIGLIAVLVVLYVLLGGIRRGKAGDDSATSPPGRGRDGTPLAGPPG